MWLYIDAVALRPGEKGIALYLAVMSAGASILLVVSIAGLVRNFAVFPRSRRRHPPADP